MPKTIGGTPRPPENNKAVATKLDIRWFFRVEDIGVSVSLGTVHNLIHQATRLGTLEDKIAAVEAKLKQLKSEQQRIEARKKAAEVQRKRQDETRRKVLVGAVVLAKLEDGTYPETEFRAMMDTALTKDEDRGAFWVTSAGIND